MLPDTEKKLQELTSNLQLIQHELKVHNNALEFLKKEEYRLVYEIVRLGNEVSLRS